MAPQGSAPFSSIFYLTKRKRLSEHLFDHRNDASTPNQQYYHENVFYPAFKAERQTNAGLHRNLLHLSQDRLRFETSDRVPLDVDDGLNRGLKYLSQLSSVMNLAEVEDFAAASLYNAQTQDKFVGKLDDIASMLESNGFSRSGTLESEPLERDLELSNRYVGPLNVSEVGNLIVLAMKLQENERLDLDLEKRLEVSAELWKNNRVPNTVSLTLVAALFKNKPFQCETCGLRFTLADTKKRHELTHRPKPDKFWYSFEGWVHMSSKGAFGFTYSRAPVTLQTFRNLLRSIPCDDDNVAWLRGMLLPDERSLKEVEMDQEQPESKEDLDDDRGQASSEAIADEATLWSWGIMDTCSQAPDSSSAVGGVETGALDQGLLKGMLRNVLYNLAMINAHKPVVAAFGDMARAFCAVCSHLLQCEFDVKYNKFMYVATTCFQLDFKLVEQAFEGHVSLDHVLSMDGLSSLSLVDLLKKVAVIKVLSVDTKSKRDLAITDWSFRYTRELLDIETSIPKVEDVKSVEKLVKGWRNPFKARESLSTGVLYAHTSCLKLLLNTHLRWVKAKLSSLDDEELRRSVRRLPLA